MGAQLIGRSDGSLFNLRFNRGKSSRVVDETRVEWILKWVYRVQKDGEDEGTGLLDCS